MTGFKRKYIMGIRDFLREYAPDFCWCSANDLFLMTEQQFEDIEKISFCVTLHQLKKQGLFAYKEDVFAATYGKRSSATELTGGAKRGLYLRINNGIT